MPKTVSSMPPRTLCRFEPVPFFAGYQSQVSQFEKFQAKIGRSHSVVAVGPGALPVAAVARRRDRVRGRGAEDRGGVGRFEKGAGEAPE